MYDVFIKLGEIFLQLFNISITASWLVLAVVVAKFILKKAPKWTVCILWALVGVRLLIPFNIESPLSLVPGRETMPVSDIYNSTFTESTQSFTPEVDSGMQVVDAILQPAISETSSVSVLRSNISVFACVWLVGIAVMLVCSFISFLRIKKSISEAMFVQDNIYLCDNISTPFILGIVKPEIYLPSSLYRDDVLYVIDHEKAHIKRLDHIWKPLGYLILTLYWFNPVMWVAYILLCKDIELACDEKVVKELDGECKKEYSNALINCSAQRRLISACPLAFGETAVKDRIKSVLNYKKPTFWVIVASIVVCIAISVTFLTVPSENTRHQEPITPVTKSVEYVYYGSRHTVKPTLILNTNNTFVFSYQASESYITTGAYTQEENLLTLTSKDGNYIYVFNVLEDGFEFDSFNSSDIPEYKVTSDSSETYCPVPDGALFIKKQIVGANSYFDATVLQVYDGSILVEPFKNEPVSQSANKLSVSVSDSVITKGVNLRIGDKIRVVYDGMIQETFPAQINGTIAIYMLDEITEDAPQYRLGGEGVSYIEYMQRTQESEYTAKVTDVEKIQRFVERFNEILRTSSADEIIDGDEDFQGSVTFINVHYVDGSYIKIKLLGNERIRLGVNERRLISSYDGSQLMDALVDSNEKSYRDIAESASGRVSLSDKDFLEKAYTLSNTETPESLKAEFGVSPGVTTWNSHETYYYSNGEYILLVEKGIQVQLRKVSDPDYKHIIA